MQRGAVLKLFKKLRLQRSLQTKNNGTAQLANKICLSMTSLLVGCGGMLTQKIFENLHAEMALLEFLNNFHAYYFI